ncbi:MAG: putative metal-binding motif-containing protein [Alphaproteobacteria bacterium]|nr:putative metal-binding motif-containing protein [Alphaproteobacteria bacterium]
MPLHPCAACGCHVLESACACPHCGARLKTCSATSKTRAALLLGLTTAGGCFIVGQPEYGVVVPIDSLDSQVDADGDGWTVQDGDCDDSNADIHPDAEETPGDGVDSNCDDADDT